MHTAFVTTMPFLEHKKTPRAVLCLKRKPFPVASRYQEKNSFDGDVVDKFPKTKLNTTQINYDKMLIHGIELIQMSLLSTP